MAANLIPLLSNVSPGASMPMDLSKLYPSIDTIQLLSYFFVPGFISMKVYDLLVPRTLSRDFSKDVYEAFGYSFINFLVVYLIISNDWVNSNLNGNILLNIFLLILFQEYETFRLRI